MPMGWNPKYFIFYFLLKGSTTCRSNLLKNCTSREYLCNHSTALSWHNYKHQLKNLQIDLCLTKDWFSYEHLLGKNKVNRDDENKVICHIDTSLSARVNGSFLETIRIQIHRNHNHNYDISENETFDDFIKRFYSCSILIFKDFLFLENTETNYMPFKLVDYLYWIISKLSYKSPYFVVVCEECSDKVLYPFSHSLWPELKDRYGHNLLSRADPTLSVSIFFPVTVVIASYDLLRLYRNLIPIVRQLITFPVIREVVVVWNGKAHLKPELSDFFQLNTTKMTRYVRSLKSLVPTRVLPYTNQSLSYGDIAFSMGSAKLSSPSSRIRILQMPRNSLLNRWRDDLNITSIATMVMDDDIGLVDASAIIKMQNIWMQHPKSLVAMFNRNYLKRKISDVVLPRLILFHSNYLSLYSQLGRGKNVHLHEYVDTHIGHCDDILLNVLSGLVNASVNFLFRPMEGRVVEFSGYVVMSRQKNRTEVRKECQLFFEEELQVKPPGVCEVERGLSSPKKPSRAHRRVLVQHTN